MKRLLAAAVCAATLLIGSSVHAQTPTPGLEEAAKTAGLEYNYDRFERTETVILTISAPDGGDLLFGFNRNNEGQQMFSMSFTPQKPAVVDSDAKAIILVDDHRIERSQKAHSYTHFFINIDGSELVEMSGSKDLSMKVAGVVFEFTTAQKIQLAKLVQMAAVGK